MPTDAPPAPAAAGDPLATPWELLERACRAWPDRTVVASEAGLLTPSALRDRVTRLAGGLSSCGVSRGSHVAVMLPNGFDAIVTMFALARLGAVEVPVNGDLVGQFLAHVIRNSRASHLVVHEQYLPQVLPALADAGLTPVLVVTGDPGQIPATAHGLGELEQRGWHGEVAEPATTTIDEPACILYTSGTTGAAKGVVLSNGYLHRHALIKVRELAITTSDVLFTCLPLFHINARVNSVLPALVTGVPLHLATRFSLSGFWNQIRDAQATVFTLIGSMAQLLLDAAPDPRDRDHRVRLAFGGPIAPHRRREFETRFGVETACGFGMTEAMGIMYQPPGGAPEACGQPVREFEVRLVDEHSADLPRGAVGELLARCRVSHGMMSGYLDNPEATADTIRDGWLYTGDLLRQGDDYEYRFIGRRKESLRRRGENISVAELEDAIRSRPGVRDCAVIGVPSELTEDDIKIVVVKDSETTLLESEFADGLRGVIPRFALPRYVEFVDDLPRTATLRVQKYVLTRDWQTSATWDVDQGCHLGAEPTPTEETRE